VTRWLIGLGLAVVLVAGCRTAGPDGESGTVLAGTSWVAEDIDGRGVLGGVQSTLVFDAAQRISGRAACNQYFGTVERAEGNRLLLKPAGSTRMACPEPVMDQERRFLETLATITTYRREASALLLLDASGKLRLRLQPLPPR
jgi:heat shock protein HslJ